MSFLETLRRAKACLEEQGRVSLRALALELEIDLERVDALVHELVDIQRVAAREGEALTWLGPTPAPAWAPSETATSPVSADHAEHRQLTVVFCDLVDSTEIASGLDPEDWREVVGRYQETAARMVERFGGYVAQYLGDGLLVYFGWPAAHEDDAERAIRSALGMMAAVAELNPRLASEHGLRLEARIGIHTGPVVMGAMGRDARAEMLAMGATANVAARLQAIASPGSVLVSEDTLQLVPGIFVTEQLPPQRLKGVARPVPMHRVLRAAGVRSRLGLSGRRLTPFVGRDREIGLLLDCWESVLEGAGRTVVVMGAAGIGKSRLVLTLRERLAGDPHTWLECRGSPYTQASPFHPTIELLEAGLAFSPLDTAEEKLRRLERGIELAGFDPRAAMPPIAALLDLPVAGDEERGDPSPETLREQTIEVLTGWILALSASQPVVLLVEDAHWLDPSSLDLLGRLSGRIAASPVLVLLTARPEFAPKADPAPRTVVAMESLRSRKARDLVEAHAGAGRLAPEAVGRIVERGDGVPLFLEELTRTALESEGEPASPAIPATLKDSLTARLDRLGAEKDLAQLASVVGRELPHRLLAGVAEREPESLRRGLARLVAGELLVQQGSPPDATYVFRHALIQEAAYDSLVRRRRRALHARVAAAIERCLPERAASEPEVVARHLDAAAMPAEAIRCYARAGERCTARSATQEAISHLTRGLELVQKLPQPQRDREELALRVALGPALIAARGSGDDETGRNYLRARELASRESPVLLYILGGLHNFHLNRGELQAAHELAEEQLETARRVSDAAQLMRAHWSVGQTLCLRGSPGRALGELQRALRLFDPDRDRRLSHDRSDPAVSLRGWLSWNAWLSGHADRAHEWADAGVALARQGGHAYTFAQALGFTSALHFMQRDRELGKRRAQETVAVAEQHGFPLYLAVARLVEAWADAPASRGVHPDGEASLALMRSAFDSLLGTGGQFARPLVAAALAEILRDSGRHDEALQALRAGLDYAAATGIRFWDADLLRLEGEILLRESGGALRDAEARLAEAKETAGKQGARPLELRAAAALARLWRDRGRRDAARELLQPLYDRFDEGFDTPDLRDAKATLETLDASAVSGGAREVRGKDRFEEPR